MIYLTYYILFCITVWVGNEIYYQVNIREDQRTIQRHWQYLTRKPQDEDRQSKKKNASQKSKKMSNTYIGRNRREPMWSRRVSSFCFLLSITMFLSSQVSIRNLHYLFWFNSWDIYVLWCVFFFLYIMLKLSIHCNLWNKNINHSSFHQGLGSNN